MQKTKEIIGTLVFCSLIGLQAVYGQDITSDLNKIRDARSAGWRKMSVQYTSFETHHAKEPEDTSQALSIENGSDSNFFDNPVSTSVSIGSKTLLLDKEEKKMYLLDQKGIFDQFGKMEPDSLLKLASGIRFMGNKSSVHSYELTFDAPVFEFSKISISLDMKSLYVKGLTLYYRKEMPKMQDAEVVAWLKPRLKIKYTPQEVSLHDKEKVSFDYYLVKKGDKWSPKPAFKNYEIIDQTSKP